MNQVTKRKAAKMKPSLAIPVLLLLSPMLVADADENLKQKANAALKAFLPLKQAVIELPGQYQNSSLDFGSRCQIRIDFSKAGEEYLSVRGDYSPANTLGDGIFFNAPEATFTQVTLDKDQLIITQSFEDSFTTGSSSTLVLTKSLGQLAVSLKIANHFLLFSDTEEKRCVAPFN